MTTPPIILDGFAAFDRKVEDAARALHEDPPALHADSRRMEPEPGTRVLAWEEMSHEYQARLRKRAGRALRAGQRTASEVAS